MSPEPSYLLWQLADSGFPAGGFAHSSGLEAALHHGHVTDAKSLYAFARQAIGQAARGALPLVAAAHRNPSALGELDELSDVFLTNPIANRASVALGRAFLISTARSFPHAPISAIESAVRGDRLAGHYAPLFGAVLRALDTELRDAHRLFLYLTAKGIGSAAVRLGVIGGYGAQELQTLFAPAFEDVISRCATVDVLDIAHTTPLIDLLQSTHDRLYSRLFQS